MNHLIRIFVPKKAALAAVMTQCRLRMVPNPQDRL
jgi:hypothetical protein